MEYDLTPEQIEDIETIAKIICNQIKRGLYLNLAVKGNDMHNNKAASAPAKM